MEEKSGTLNIKKSYINTLQKNLKWYNRGVVGANVFVNRLH